MFFAGDNESKKSGVARVQELQNGNAKKFTSISEMSARTVSACEEAKRDADDANAVER
jgi:hypothetical protein